MNILSIVLSILASVISGMALFFLQKYFRQKEKKEEENRKANAKENILILKSINALGKLTEANAIALRDGKTNGEMHTALKEYSHIEKEMYDYLLEQNSKN